MLLPFRHHNHSNIFSDLFPQQGNVRFYGLPCDLGHVFIRSDRHSAGKFGALEDRIPDLSGHDPRVVAVKGLATGEVEVELVDRGIFDQGSDTAKQDIDLAGVFGIKLVMAGDE